MSGNSQLQQDVIYIKSRAAGNGITSLLIAAILLAIGALAIYVLPANMFLLGVLILSGSIVSLVIGAYKLQEPKYSMEISKKHILYRNRKGSWIIDWDNIRRIDVPRLQRGLEHIDLELIGIRMKQPLLFMDNASPRLITYLLMEQRPLLVQAARQNDCQTGQCYGDDLIEDTKFKLDDGQVITGVNAMFANRMNKLNTALGYDVYIPVNDVDREPHEFVQLLRDCLDKIQQDKLIG